MSRPRLAARVAGLAALALLVALLLPAGAGARKAPRRIVALTPFAANTLAKLGVTPVAVGQTLGGREHLSPKLRSVPVLQLSHPDGPNLEQLAALHPDLVLSSQTWAKGNEAMEALGIKVEVRDPRSIRGALADTYKIGEVVGRKHYARELLKQMRGRISGAEAGIRRHPKVMLILGVGHAPFTFLPNSWGGDIVEAAGGELLTGGASSGSGFQRISDEVVVAENPEIIIAVPHADPEDIPALKQYFEDDPAWSSTKAAKTGNVYISTDNSLLQAGTEIARLITRVREDYLHN
ncbi:MAG TPA: ABC transporter substrate-binding protein [Solirubrobacterales bacterium]|nr:ABC transporter substrate-binding protein [Solirubrobacterales bacterium]